MSDMPTRPGLEEKQGMDLLRENIPGGMFQCLYDENLTILQMNDEFLKVVGYTRDEIREEFHNHFIELIDERDREKALLDAMEQLRDKDTKELEYRVKGKGGREIWVLDEGKLLRSESGPGSFCCILIDITKIKLVQENYRLALQRHQIIMDQTNDILFEWDIEQDRMDFSNNWKKKFGYDPMTHSISTSLDKKSHIYGKDQHLFKEILDEIRSGVHYAEREIRIRTLKDGYIWCRIRITGQENSEGRTVKAVGAIIDINNEKRQEQQLIQIAQRDMLTKLYNKGTCERLIEEHLERGQIYGGCCVLFILDIDDFKLVNDTMGHLFGDAYLAKMAEEIQKQFRSQDIIGRIGGDEFMIYIKDIPDIQIVHKKARKLIHSLSRLAVPEMGELKVSCSIGIALVPEHGNAFQELYHNADLALYQAKSKGKNTYVIYDRSMGVRVPGIVKRMDSALGAKIDSNEGIKALNNQFIEYIFRILYKSDDIFGAVQSILELVGRQFNVSRVYIFENTEDGRYCRNTFEWCNKGVAAEIDNLKLVSYEEDLGGTYVKNFDEKGIFYCPDISRLNEKQYNILAPQGIQSMLQCAIRDNGVFKGYVGFDECRTKRYWTQEQIDVLNFVSELLSTFLLKQRAQERADHALKEMRSIVDRQNNWIYVIHPGTFHLVYMNNKLKERIPEGKCSVRCYEAIYQRNSPCEHCPACKLGGCGESEIQELWSPVLKAWSAADASPINWEGMEAVMVTCHDITRYKQEL